MRRAQLDEPLERLRALRRSRHSAGSSTPRRQRRGLDEVVRAAHERRPPRRGTPSARGELLVGQRREHVDRERADPRRGRGARRAAAGRAPRGTRAPPRPGSPASRSDGDRRALGALRELLAVVADDEPVVDHLRRLRAERAVQRRVQLLVRPVVGAADHVRDPEVGVVDDAREVERRRARRRARASRPRSAAAARPRAPPRGGARRASSAAPGPRPSRRRASAGRRARPPRRPARCAPGRCRRSAAAASRRSGGSRPR